MAVLGVKWVIQTREHGGVRWQDALTYYSESEGKTQLSKLRSGPASSVTALRLMRRETTEAEVVC